MKKLFMVLFLISSQANATVVFVGKVPVVIGSVHSKKNAEKEKPKEIPKQPTPYYGCSDGLDQYSRPCTEVKK